MKAIHKKCLLAVAALAFAGTANAQQAAIADDDTTPVYVNTEKLSGYLAERVEAEAQKGLRALTNYVQRTRTIHHLYMPTLLGAQKD